MTGPRFMALSALSFAVMAACVKVAGETGIPLLQIIAVRAVISIGLSYISIRKAGAALLGHHRVLLFARGLVGFLALTCVFYALLNLPLALATLLQYLHPIFTALLAWLFLRETPDRSTLICVALSLCGLLTILWPMFSASDTQDAPVFAVTMGLAGAFGSARVVAAAAGYEHSAAVTEDGALWPRHPGRRGGQRGARSCSDRNKLVFLGGRTPCVRRAR